MLIITLSQSKQCGSEGGSYRKEKEKGEVMCDVYAQVVR